MSSKSTTRLALTLALLSSAFGLGRTWSAPVTAPPPDQITLRSVSDGLSQLAAEVSPAVVQVRTLRARGRRMRTLREGSGVIVTSDGHVITNHHVVEGGTEYRVVLPTGRRLTAEIVGQDPDTDLALLRITSGRENERYPALEIAPERNPRVGEMVLAIGCPMGLGHSVTSGIVCGLGRSDLDLVNYEDFIQTDAVINPGNSGGPLLDMSGRVVGINAALGLESQGDDGIAFAIPSSMVSKVLRDLLEKGEVVRGCLGVEAEWWFDPDTVPGYEGVSRVRVSAFLETSPARTAGIEVGDILLAVGQKRLITRKDLMTGIAETAPGQTVAIKLWRDAETITVDVELGRCAPNPK
jgi:serine protease DegQ